MKRINICFLILCISFVFVACNDVDNYDLPTGGIKGTIYDEQTNEPIPLAVPGSTGVMINLMEQSETATKSIDIYAKQDGTYEHAQMFNADYLVTVKGPFVNKCEGLTTVKGQTTFDLKALPYSRISITASVSGTNQISIQYKVSPTSPSYTVSEITGLWNFAPGVDVGTANLAGKTTVKGNEGTIVFDLSKDKTFLDNLHKIQSNGNKIYLRVAAKINNAVNYSTVATVTI